MLEWLHRFNKWQSHSFIAFCVLLLGLDWIVHDRFKSKFDETCVHVIQVITGYLRCQINLMQRMK